MRIEGRKIDFFPDLYDSWKHVQEQYYNKLAQHMEQYKGDPTIDGSAEAAKVVRNITYELIEAQVSTHIPTPIITPKIPTASHARYARNAMEYLKLQLDEQPFEEMNDIDERRTKIYGGDGFIIEWDNSWRTHTEIGRPEVTCVNPCKIVGQPGVYSIQDMDACFVVYNTTREDVQAKYGVTIEQAEMTEPDEDTPSDAETVTVVVCWYKDEDGNVCKYAFSDSVELEDIEDFWARKSEICDTCGKSAELVEDEDKKGRCRCGGKIIKQNEDYRELTRDIVTSDGRIIPAMSPKYRNGEIVTEKVKVPLMDDMGNPVMEDADGLPRLIMQEIDEPVMERTRIPYYKPRFIPVVIRKNTSQEEHLLGQSDCEFIRPQQQEINKLETRIQEKLINSSVTPVMPEGARTTYTNKLFEAVIRLKPGESKSDYGIINTTPDISSDVMQADRIYDQAKRLLGITDTYLGQPDTTAQSGIAKQIQVQRSSGRLASKQQMKAAAYQDIYMLMFEMAIAYADEPRNISLSDEFGIVHGAQFNPFDYLELDEESNEWYYDLSYTFSADTSTATEEHGEQRWAQIAQDYSAGLYGDPKRTDARLRMWLDREKSGYPDAHRNVEYERKMLQAEIEASRRGNGLQEVR
jgi:hypothetical protein